jgi:hypothetical protein
LPLPPEVLAPPSGKPPALPLKPPVPVPPVPVPVPPLGTPEDDPATELLPALGEVSPSLQKGKSGWGLMQALVDDPQPGGRATQFWDSQAAPVARAPARPSTIAS